MGPAYRRASTFRSAGRWRRERPWPLTINSRTLHSHAGDSTFCMLVRSARRRVRSRSITPWREERTGSGGTTIPPTAAGPERLGVFGGSFDPIHVGHLIVAEIFRHQLRLDQVLFLPTGRPPHKPTRRLADDADRVAMIEMSIAGAPGMALSRIDIDRGGYSYTSETLVLVRSTFPRVESVHFLLGQDSFRDFPTWHNPGDIARQAHLGVALRPNVVVHLEDVLQRVPELRGRVEVVDVPLMQVSSSDIRMRVRTGLPYRFQVLPSVADYIQARGLYLDDESGALTTVTLP